ncbi:hypothetical protein UFOVP330_96, partial [uncultured Caudovirales phage]
MAKWREPFTKEPEPEPRTKNPVKRFFEWLFEPYTPEI